METELIRPVVKIGNSSGVILPKSWINQEARVEIIIKNPSDILASLLDILKNEIPLNKVLGIYLTGSYARKEEKIDSDIDVLIITDNINKSFKKGKYELLLISKENLINSLKNNALPLLPMLKESMPLLNEVLINEFKSMHLTKKSIEWHIKTTKDAIKENQSLIEMIKILKEDKVDDSIAYSLILRLRGIYVLDCLKKNKSWSNEYLLKLIKKIAGSTLSYERYNYVKNEKGENKSKLSLKEAEKLLNHIIQKNNQQEKW